MRYHLFKHLHDGTNVFSVLDGELERADVVLTEQAAVSEKQANDFVQDHQLALEGVISERDYLRRISVDHYAQRLHKTLLRLRKPVLFFEHYPVGQAMALQRRNDANVQLSYRTFAALALGNADKALEYFDRFLQGRKAIDSLRDRRIAEVLQDPAYIHCAYPAVPEDGLALCLLGREHSLESYLPFGFFDKITVCDIIGDSLPAVLPSEGIDPAACIVLAVFGDVLLTCQTPVQRAHEILQAIKGDVNPLLLQDLARSVRTEEYHEEYLDKAASFFSVRKPFAEYIR